MCTPRVKVAEAGTYRAKGVRKPAVPGMQENAHEARVSHASPGARPVCALAAPAREYGGYRGRRADRGR